MKKTLLSLAACALFAANAMSQVVVKTNAGDLNLRLIGRTNLDYGRYIPHSDGLNYGVKMNDTRLGCIATFDKDWTAKMEICYANRAVSFRDLWIGYKINDKMSLTGGNHFQPFGAKILGLGYKFIEDAQADYAICPSRKIGVSYDKTDDAVNQFLQWVLTNGTKFNHEYGLLNLDNKLAQVQIDKVKTILTAQK